MDKSGEIQQEQENVTGVAPCDSQMAYSHNQNDPLVASGTPSVAVPTPAQPPAAFSNSIDQLVACGTPSVAVPTPTQPPAGFSNSIDQLVACGTPSVTVPTPTQPPVGFSNSIDQLVASGTPSVVIPTPTLLPATFSNSINQQQQQQDFHHQLQQQQHFGHQQQQQDFGQQLQQQQDFHQPLQQQLKVFWENQMQEIVQTDCFSKHSFPPTRIKRIMKMDEDVQLVSADAPVLFAKACEMFLLDLTLRSWFHAKENKRSKLQTNDVATATKNIIAFDFLDDIIPKGELKEEEGPGIAQLTIPIEEGRGIEQSTIPIAEGLGIAQSTIPIAEGHGIAQSTFLTEEEIEFAQSTIPRTGPAADLPYYDVPPQHPVGSTGMVMGNPVDQAALYSTLHPQPPNPNPQPPQQQSTALYSTIPIEEGRGIELSTIPIAEGLGIAESNIPIKGPANQMQEIDQTDCFPKHSFPLNRIKKIMKMDEDVLQVSADAPVLFAKACEMFILDLTSRSWFQAKEIKRSTLQKNHVAAVIASNFAFNFLVDIIPKDELKEEEGPGIAQSTIPIEEGLGISQSTIPIEGELGFAQSTIPITGPAADLPYNDVPPQHPVGSTGMIMGNPVDQAALYSTLQPNPNPPPPQQQSTTVHSTQLPRPPV